MHNPAVKNKKKSEALIVPMKQLTAVEGRGSQVQKNSSDNFYVTRAKVVPQPGLG